MTTTIFDADSHLMETGDWLREYADPDVRDRLLPLSFDAAGSKAAELCRNSRASGKSTVIRTLAPMSSPGRKGGWHPAPLTRTSAHESSMRWRSPPSWCSPPSRSTSSPSARISSVRYGGTHALNRAMVAFCAPDPRLKAVGFLPLADPERAVIALEEALAGGVAAIWVPSEAPGDFSPAHVDLDPVWARLAEAGVPFVLHVGGGKLLPRAFHNNGLPRPTDWLGGGENLRAKDFPVVHHSPERFLACLALDGVFERHPNLHGAAIELGATWVPGMLRNVDYAHRSFSKFEPALKALPLLPSEYLRRQVRFTPFPFEDTAWLHRTVRSRALHVLHRLSPPRRRPAPIRDLR